MTVRKARAKKQIKRTLSRLSPEESKELLGETTVETPVPTGRKPGQIIQGRKTIYTRRDLDNIYGLCEFTPDETIKVTVQGVPFQLIVGVSMIAPTIVKDIYEQHKKELRNAGKGFSESGYESIVALGAGSLEP